MKKFLTGLAMAGALSGTEIAGAQEVAHDEAHQEAEPIAQKTITLAELTACVIISNDHGDYIFADAQTNREIRFIDALGAPVFPGEKDGEYYTVRDGKKMTGTQFVPSVSPDTKTFSHDREALVFVPDGNEAIYRDGHIIVQPIGTPPPEQHLVFTQNP